MPPTAAAPWLLARADAVPTAEAARVAPAARTRTSAPEVTVVLPHYGCERYLRDAVESILRQEVDLDLWIVDDCSPDRRWLDAIEDLAADQRVALFQTTRNVGHYRIKNSLLPMLRSRFIAFQDADDVSHPGRLRAQLAELRRTGAAMIGTGFVYLSETGEALAIKRMVKHCNAWLRLGKSFVLLHPTSLVRREVFDAIGGFDGTARVAADDDFLLRASRVFPIRNVPAPLYSYRTRADSLTGSVDTGHRSTLRQRYRDALLARHVSRRHLHGRELLDSLRPPPNDVPFELRPVTVPHSAARGEACAR